MIKENRFFSLALLVLKVRSVARKSTTAFGSRFTASFFAPCCTVHVQITDR